MLLSPGHSPCHISTLTPSSSSSSQRTQTLDSLNPNPRKRKAPSVLDEDSYVADIEKIIERDFFPDIPKLRDQLDWIHAVLYVAPSSSATHSSRSSNAAATATAPPPGLIRRRSRSSSTPDEVATGAKTNKKQPILLSDLLSRMLEKTDRSTIQEKHRSFSSIGSGRKEEESDERRCS